MTGIVTEDLADESSCEAVGHPDECVPVVDGKIVHDGSHSVTVNGEDGKDRLIATKASATMEFESHAHTYDSEDEKCIDNQSHSLTPDEGKYLSTVTINGSPLYKSDTGVTTDPGSGGNVNI